MESKPSEDAMKVVTDDYEAGVMAARRMGEILEGRSKVGLILAGPARGR